ncbi:MAG: hypothetical protein HY245_06250 [Rhizobiales bacterium]|nr:hypothetical protein [Hyphomicrobiales bacterium]
MTRMIAIAPAALLALGLVVAPALAEEAAKTTATSTTSDTTKNKTTSKPVDIEADQMEVLNKEKKAIFRGNVIAKRSDVTLNTDLLNVDYEEVKQADGTSKNDVTRLEATGNVVITTAKEKITGEWAKMNPKTNELEVGGSEVVVVQGQTTIRG